MIANFMLLSEAQNAQPPKPTSPDIPGPIEALKKFLEGVSATEAAWMIVAWVLVGILYWVSIQQLNRGRTTYRTVLWWIAGLCGWAFSFYLYGWLRIRSEGILPMILAGCSAILALIAVLLVKNRTHDWQQIISGTIIIIMGFTVTLTIAMGATALSYGIVFGCTFGMIMGMLIISIQRLNKNPEPATTGEWSEARPKSL